MSKQKQPTANFAEPDWKYYKHALIPTTPPHKEIDASVLDGPRFWHSFDESSQKILFARWSSDWDCGEETSYWYVIKDTPFDIASLKSKRRYEINKGLSHFRVGKLDYKAEKDGIYHVRLAAGQGYSKTPKIDQEKLFSAIEHRWDTLYTHTYGAWSKETGKLCAYALCRQNGRYMNFALLYANPNCEKFGVNAALVYGVLQDLESFLASGGYLCDGSRTLVHETAFQDYLEKYFEFRKAYCHLHIKYHGIGHAIKLLYPFRKCFSKRIFKNLYALLQMEEIART